MLMHTSFSWSCPHADIIRSPSSPSPILTVSTSIFPQTWSFLFYITYVICSPPRPHCLHLSPDLVLSCPHHMCPVALSISSLRASFSPSHELSDSLRRGTGCDWPTKHGSLHSLQDHKHPKSREKRGDESRKGVPAGTLCLYSVL